MPVNRRIVHLPRIFCALKGLLMIPRRTFLRSLSVAPFVAKAALAKKSAAVLAAAAYRAGDARSDAAGLGGGEAAGRSLHFFGG